MKIKNVILKNKQHRIFIKKMQATQENNKVLGLVRDTRKNIEKGERKMKNEKYKKNQITASINLFLLLFKYFFFENIVWKT